MNTIECNNAMYEIANGYYNRTYWPEKYPERVDIVLGGIAVSAIFLMPPTFEEFRDFRKKELFSKVYIVPNDQRIQDIVKSAIKPCEESNTLTPLKFKGLSFFINNPNYILERDQFILAFFPDEESRETQIKKDQELQHKVMRAGSSCQLL